MQLLMYHIHLRSSTISQNFPRFEQYFLMPFFAGDSCKVNKCNIGAGGGFTGGAAGKSVQIRRRSRPWLPLWGSCRANARLRGCRQWQIWEKYRDCYMVPSQSRLAPCQLSHRESQGAAAPPGAPKWLRWGLGGARAGVARPYWRINPAPCASWLPAALLRPRPGCRPGRRKWWCPCRRWRAEVHRTGC